MQKFIFIFSFLLIAKFSFAQINLVPNPSFEIYSSCPSGPDEVVNSNGWSAYKESPDYLNTCATIFATVPTNQFGFQSPSYGNAYCGIWAYATSTFYREIIGSQLSSPLIIGQKYFVSFEAVLSNNGYGSCAIDNIGAKFSITPFSFGNPAPINNSAQVYSSVIIIDTLNWTKISGSFIADSAYGYVMLGNFFDDATTDTTQVYGNPNCVSYYCIENVCVSLDSLYAATWTSANEIDNDNNFSVFPNPVSDKICYLSSTERIISVEIFDLLGKKIEIQISCNINSGMVNFDNIDQGIYLIKTRTNNNYYLNKILLINN